MKITLRYCGLTPRAIWQALVENQFRKLQPLASVDQAHVTVEWQRQNGPAFRVHAHLEVPGPDYHAEAADHTLPAALFKVIHNLERQMRSRKNRRLGRRKTNIQLGLSPANGSMGLAAGRA